MESIWSKMDSGLATIYINYRTVQADATATPLPQVRTGRIRVELYYRGSLEALVRQGFLVEHDDKEGYATGVLELQDLEAIGACVEVVALQYGSQPRPQLDQSVPLTKADKVRNVGAAPDFKFSGNAGEGVLIGVIDTGIDFSHPFFWKGPSPSSGTRILRLWDPELVPQEGEKSPVKSLLHPGSGGTYGVEYTDEDINDDLVGIPGAYPVRHRDIIGHGTGVAAVASGNGRSRPDEAPRLIGVAPCADLIVVKAVGLDSMPKVFGVEVSFEQLIKDAISYILNTAAKMDRPVAINCSFGSPLGAHDGFDFFDEWMRNKFADPVSQGKVCVYAAGNVRDGQHATIDFIAGESVEISIAVTDTRERPNGLALHIDFYYPQGPIALTGAFRPHGAKEFSEALPIVGTKTGSIGEIRGYILSHRQEPGMESGTPRTRNVFRVTLTGRRGVLHESGVHTVRLTASGGPMVVHGWTSESDADVSIGFCEEQPSAVRVSSEFQVVSTATLKNIVAVGAGYYSSDDPPMFVAPFSARGPVPRHDYPTSIYCEQTPSAPDLIKPDLGAPGNVVVAKSKESGLIPPGTTKSWLGTSFAAPHVTGAVALMLKKNRKLTPSQVIGILKDTAAQDPPINPQAIGAGWLNVEAALNEVPELEPD